MKMSSLTTAILLGAHMHPSRPIQTKKPEREKPNKRRNMLKWRLARLARLKCLVRPSTAQKARIRQIQEGFIK